MKRVVVIGSSGAGKSVLSRRLGDLTGLPVIHLDHHHWRPGWTEPPAEVWRDQVTEMVKGEEWIIDGNFGGTMELRLQNCDTVIFLDLPRHVCTWRVVKRMVKYYGRTRPDLAPDCPERFDFPFLKWVWNFQVRSKPAVERRIAKVEDRTDVHILKNDREVEAFLNSVRYDHADNWKRIR